MSIEGIKGAKYNELLFQGLQMLSGMTEEQDSSEHRAKKARTLPNPLGEDQGPTPKVPRTRVPGVSNSNLT